MLSKSDLDGPAQVRFEPAATAIEDARIDWSDAKGFQSLREALHWVTTTEAPAGREPLVRTASGRVLRPDILEELWASVQGP
jgi:hypothetical protein